MTAVVVIAKECVPGRVKTRLHPPLTLEQAARAAGASLTATLSTVGRLDADRRILFYDGANAPAAAKNFEIVRQPPGTLDERLAYAFDLLNEPVVLIGMDTPQFSAADLNGAVECWPDEFDAVFGPATDGGFWALGMRRPRGDLVRGVAMSRYDTGDRQRTRLLDAGLRILELPTLRDIDTIDDLKAVSAMLDHPADLWPADVAGAR